MGNCPGGEWVESVWCGLRLVEPELRLRYGDDVVVMGYAAGVYVPGVIPLSLLDRSSIPAAIRYGGWVMLGD